MQKQNPKNPKSKPVPLKHAKAQLKLKRRAGKVASKARRMPAPAQAAKKEEKKTLNPEAFPILNMQGEEIAQIKLDKQVFDGEVNAKLLYQAVNLYLANRRQGNAATKTRGEVSGGGIKPWRQKGTGRARHGSIRSPLWRHGGITFGPHPRDYSYSLSQTTRNQALKASLNAKIASADLIVMDDLKLSSHKTKELLGVLKKLQLKDKTLILTKDLDQNLARVCRNIPYCDVQPVNNANAYEVMRCKKLIFTKDALEQVCERIK